PPLSKSKNLHSLMIADTSNRPSDCAAPRPKRKKLRKTIRRPDFLCGCSATCSHHSTVLQRDPPQELLRSLLSNGPLPPRPPKPASRPNLTSQWMCNAAHR